MSEIEPGSMCLVQLTHLRQLSVHITGYCCQNTKLICSWYEWVLLSQYLTYLQSLWLGIVVIIPQLPAVHLAHLRQLSVHITGYCCQNTKLICSRYEWVLLSQYLTYLQSIWLGIVVTIPNFNPYDWVLLSKYLTFSNSIWLGIALTIPNLPSVHISGNCCHNT